MGIQCLCSVVHYFEAITVSYKHDEVMTGVVRCVVSLEDVFLKMR
ncbi:hypothetical protein P303_04370 [Xylella fastidiosa MUL0034]|nr:hypothetical protein P303_04370 [Xylella fastidiosa MUL0034]